METKFQALVKEGVPLVLSKFIQYYYMWRTTQATYISKNYVHHSCGVKQKDKHSSRCKDYFVGASLV